MSEIEVTSFATGAVRGTDREETAYHLMSPIALRAYARVCAEGAKKYEPMNWEMGMPVADILKHAMGHIVEFLAGDRSEDHLGHLLWNAAAAVHSFEKWPHLNTDLRGPNCELTKEQRARIGEANAQRAAKKQAAETEPDTGLPDTTFGVQESPFDRQKRTGRLSGVTVQHGLASPSWPKQV